MRGKEQGKNEVIRQGMKERDGIRQRNGGNREGIRKGNEGNKEGIRQGNEGGKKMGGGLG